MEENRLALKPGQPIQDYIIESILGAGGFGIVYKARHKYLDNKFAAIKEFLPSHLATREGTTVHTIEATHSADFAKGIEGFINEARQLVKFKKHPNIVDCQGFTKENGTAYLIMEYEDGYPLSQVINSKASKGRKLDQSQILHLMNPVIDGLAYIHSQGVLHRDIKPDNIFIRSETEAPVLIDFGVSKQDFASRTKSTQAAYTPGYAPFEQTSDSAQIGPWTDIYALGMVMWVMISLKNPWEYDSARRAMAILKGNEDPLPSAVSIGEGSYNIDFLSIIDKCLCVDETQRFQSMEELSTAISEIGMAKSKINKPEVPSPAKIPQKGKDRLIKHSLTAKQAKSGIEQELLFESHSLCDECFGQGRRLQGDMNVTCQHCQGNGNITQQKKVKVSIPAGSKMGDRILVVGEGDDGLLGGEPGDLYVQITVKNAVKKKEKTPLVIKVFVILMAIGFILTQQMKPNTPLKKAAVKDDTLTSIEQKTLASREKTKKALDELDEELKKAEAKRTKEKTATRWKVAESTPNVIKLENGILKIVTKKGNGKQRERYQDYQLEQYVVRNSQGKVIDSLNDVNSKLQPLSFHLDGAYSAVHSMTEGESAYFFIPAHLAWGVKGTAGILPNENIYFEVSNPKIVDASPSVGKQNRYVTYVADLPSKTLLSYINSPTHEELVFDGVKSGVYAKELSEGNKGIILDPQSRYEMKFSVRYINGDTLLTDAKESKRMDSKNMPTGLWITLLNMRVGQKREAVIPYYLMITNIKGKKLSEKIKEMDIIFTVEVLSIEDGKSEYTGTGSVLNFDKKNN